MYKAVQAKELKEFVLSELQSYAESYETPEPGSMLGVPFSKEKILEEVEEIKNFVVDPYIQEIDLEDFPRGNPKIEQCWIVMEEGDFKLAYDESEKEFVLCMQRTDLVWASIGVRGDVTSTFIAR